MDAESRKLPQRSSQGTEVAYKASTAIRAAIAQRKPLIMFHEAALATGGGLRAEIAGEGALGEAAPAEEVPAPIMEEAGRGGLPVAG